MGERNRDTDRKKVRQAESQKDSWTGKQTDRRKVKQTDKQTESLAE